MNRLVICFEILPHFNNDDCDIAIACYAAIISVLVTINLLIKCQTYAYAKMNRIYSLL